MTRFALTVMAVISLGLPADAAASTISISGEFTSFRSWILPPANRPAAVNGVPLVPTGLPVGSNGTTPYFFSDTILFGANTTEVVFRYDDPPNLANRLAFIPTAPVDVNVGEEFWTGSFSFTNGQWFPYAEIGFRLTTNSPDPLLANHVFTGTIGVESVTLESLDPVTEADYFYFLERPDLGSCRVYDLAIQPPSNPGNVGLCQFYARIGSLIPTRFGAASNAAFVSPSTTADPFPSVPEPAALLLVGTGFAAVVQRRRRTRAWRSAS